MKKIVLYLLLLLSFSGAEEIYATFDVEAERHADLAFSASGTVLKVYVDVGSRVRRGEILAELDNKDIEAALQIAKIAEKYAKRDYERQLEVKNLVDAARLDQYAFKYENAKAQAIYQQALLDKTYLKAPFDGVIYEKSVEAGDAVSGAMLRTVMKIQSPKARKLVLYIDQKYHRKLRPGLTFRYKVDGEETVRTGAIVKVYPYADAKNRMIKAEVPAEGLTPGLFGDGVIILPETKK
jgi:RND family efflux transporter MFP subunit